MLMKPVGGRHEQTSRTPVDPDARLSFFPKEGIPFAGENHDVRAGSVPVAARVSPGRILLEVGAHRVGGEMQSNARGALTSEASVPQLKVFDSRIEVGFPNPLGRDLSSLPAIIPVFAAKSVRA